MLANFLIPPYLDIKFVKLSVSKSPRMYDSASPTLPLDIISNVKPFFFIIKLALFNEFLFPK